MITTKKKEKEQRHSTYQFLPNLKDYHVLLSDMFESRVATARVECTDHLG